MFITHPISPCFDADSRILILGSFPSVKSREQMFFYGHPQNRFWKVLAAALEEGEPASVPEKKELLAKHHIALWDVIGSCEIEGSSDASIGSVTSNDLSAILDHAKIRRILVNGKTAEKYYKKFSLPKTKTEAVCLPSTSPANAAWSLEKLVRVWSAEIRKGLAEDEASLAKWPEG